MHGDGYITIVGRKSKEKSNIPTRGEYEVLIERYCIPFISDIHSDNNKSDNDESENRNSIINNGNNTNTEMENIKTANISESTIVNKIDTANNHDKNHTKLHSIRVSSIHFLSNNLILAVSNLGHLQVLKIYYDLNSQIRIEMVQTDEDNLPNLIGPCASNVWCSSNSLSSNSMNSGIMQANNTYIALMLAIDAWTSQLFTMTVLSVQDIITAKIHEGCYSSALSLAYKYSVDINTVYQQQWLYLCQQQKVTIDDVATVFDNITEVEEIWIMTQALAFISKDLTVWILVLQSAMNTIIRLISDDINDENINITEIFTENIDNTDINENIVTDDPFNLFYEFLQSKYTKADMHKTTLQQLLETNNIPIQKLLQLMLQSNNNNNSNLTSTTQNRLQIFLDLYFRSCRVQIMILIQSSSSQIQSENHTSSTNPIIKGESERSDNIKKLFSELHQEDDNQSHSNTHWFDANSNQDNLFQLLDLTTNNNSSSSNNSDSIKTITSNNSAGNSLSTSSIMNEENSIENWVRDICQYNISTISSVTASLNTNNIKSAKILFDHMSFPSGIDAYAYIIHLDIKLLISYLAQSGQIQALICALHLLPNANNTCTTQSALSINTNQQKGESNGNGRVGSAYEKDDILYILSLIPEAVSPLLYQDILPVLSLKTWHYLNNAPSINNNDSATTVEENTQLTILGNINTIRQYMNCSEDDLNLFMSIYILSLASSHNKSYNSNTNMAIKTINPITSFDNSNHDSINDDEMNLRLSYWYLLRLLNITCVGYIDEALQFCDLYLSQQSIVQSLYNKNVLEKSNNHSHSSSIRMIENQQLLHIQSLFKEIYHHLYHFHLFIQRGLLRTNEIFIDWLLLPLETKLYKLFHSDTHILTPLFVMNEYIRPMFEGTYKIHSTSLSNNNNDSNNNKDTNKFSLHSFPSQIYELIQEALRYEQSQNTSTSSSNNSFLKSVLSAQQKQPNTNKISCVQEYYNRNTYLKYFVINYIDTNSDNIQVQQYDHLSEESDIIQKQQIHVSENVEWEYIATRVMSTIVQYQDFSSMKQIVDVIVASKPILPIYERCVHSIHHILELAIVSCLAFDNTTIEGISLMWQIIECLPSKIEDKKLAVIIDEIQNILSSSELMIKYNAAENVPPLTSMLSFSNKVPSGILKQKQIIKHAIKGCGSLTVTINLNNNASSGNNNDTSTTMDTSASIITTHQLPSTDMLSNTISIYQVIVLNICMGFGSLFMNTNPDDSTDYTDNNNHHSNGLDKITKKLNIAKWVSFIRDINELFTFFPVLNTVEKKSWIAHIIINTMLHFHCIYVFEWALSGILSFSQWIETGQKGDPHNGNNGQLEMGHILGKMGVSYKNMEHLIISQAIEIFNSVSSCDDDELHHYYSLLNVFQSISTTSNSKPNPKTAATTSNTNNNSNPSIYSKELTHEYALAHLVRILSQCRISLVPVQLRLLSPELIFTQILERNPQLIYNFNIIYKLINETHPVGIINNELNSTDIDIQDNINNDSNIRLHAYTDYLSYRNALHQQTYHGYSFLQFFMKTFQLSVDQPINLQTPQKCNNNNDTSHSTTNSNFQNTSNNTSIVKIKIALINTLISLDDLENAYLVCIDLWRHSRYITSEYDSKEMFEITYLIIALLEKDDNSNNDNSSYNMSAGAIDTSWTKVLHDDDEGNNNTESSFFISKKQNIDNFEKFRMFLKKELVSLVACSCSTENLMRLSDSLLWNTVNNATKSSTTSLFLSSSSHHHHTANVTKTENSLSYALHMLKTNNIHVDDMLYIKTVREILHTVTKQILVHRGMCNNTLYCM